MKSYLLMNQNLENKTKWHSKHLDMLWHYWGKNESLFIYFLLLVI